MTLQLILTVDYIPNGVTKQAIKDKLESGAEFLLNAGLLTGESEAEVEDHQIEVREIAD